MKFASLVGRLAAVCFVGALVIAIVPDTAGASPVTLYVATGGSNTNNNCQVANVPCQTIGYALSIAPSGATVDVQAGVYNEQLTINKAVTIVGAGSSRTVIEPSALPSSDKDTDSTLPQFAVVDVTSATDVNLEDLGVNGSAATPSFDSDGFGCAQDFVGVYFHDSSGSMSYDSVTGIELPADLFGCQGGLGVYAATDSASALQTSLTMSNDTVGTYDKNGITCDDPGTTCVITHSSVTGIGSTPAVAQNGVQIWAASGSLSNDTITRNTYDGPTYAASGILVLNPSTLSVLSNVVTSNDSDMYVLQDQSPDWVLCGNTILPPTCTNPAKAGAVFNVSKNRALDATNAYGNPPGFGFADGIDFDSITQATTVKSNVASGDPGNGISLYGATKVAATKNTASDDGNGMYLGSGTASSVASANTLLKNNVSAAAGDGILADTGSSGNTLKKNTISVSASFDAQDNSIGTGTSGTANLWSHNACTTSSPAGLCSIAHGPRTGTVNHGARSSRSHHIGVTRRVSSVR
ncbi:MAG TPA: NosD domain-containing protein [Acidimicrobiales bacterium]|nr:NosD domain-containing protein [Acidimicrobiales bacterium]